MTRHSGKDHDEGVDVTYSSLLPRPPPFFCSCVCCLSNQTGFRGATVMLLVSAPPLTPKFHLTAAHPPEIHQGTNRVSGSIPSREDPALHWCSLMSFQNTTCVCPPSPPPTSPPKLPTVLATLWQTRSSMCLFQRTDYSPPLHPPPFFVVVVVISVFGCSSPSLSVLRASLSVSLWNVLLF